MSNTKLIFNHAIPIEVFTEADAATVKLLINGEICFEKEYNGNTVHRELIPCIFHFSFCFYAYVLPNC